MINCVAKLPASCCCCSSNSLVIKCMTWCSRHQIWLMLNDAWNLHLASKRKPHHCAAQRTQNSACAGDCFRMHIKQQWQTTQNQSTQEQFSSQTSLACSGISRRRQVCCSSHIMIKTAHCLLLFAAVACYLCISGQSELNLSDLLIHDHSSTIMHVFFHIVAQAQCMTGAECFGTAIPGLNTFDDCCRAVLADFSLARSFVGGSRCFPCYGKHGDNASRVPSIEFNCSDWSGGSQIWSNWE